MLHDRMAEAAARNAFGLLLLLATAIAVDLVLALVYAHFPGDPLIRALAPAFPVSYKNWVMWAAFVPLVLLVARRVVTAEGAPARRVAVTLVCGVALALSHSLIEMWLHRAEGSHHVTSSGFLSYHFFHGLLTYAAVFTVALLMESGRAEGARERRELALRSEISEAQLALLRAQIQPHFLFNTLNSISAMVEDDVRGGQRMITQLSDFLRLTLTNSEHRMVPLREELRLLESYVGIQRARFGGRLAVVYDVEPDTADTLVPNLLLQPLVENAIKHGIQPVVDGGTVRVRARREERQLVLEILDDGAGYSAAGADPAGHGLRSTRDRLRHSYGGVAALEIAPLEPRGTAVTLRLPVRAPVETAVAL